MGCAGSQPEASAESCIVEEAFYDKYLLGAKIGKGAFAQVRLATKAKHSTGPLRPDESDDVQGRAHAEFAVKIVDLRQKDNLDHVDSSLHKTSQKEAMAWKSVGKHPNCVRLYDVYFNGLFC
jgi:serine/threonine protein kinase